MNNLVLIVLMFSIFGELVPIPLMELNQAILLIFGAIYIFKDGFSKKRRIKDIYSQIFISIFIVLIFYIIFPGILNAIDIENYFRTLKNLVCVFLFIFIVFKLSFNDYEKILYKFTYFASIFFIFESIIYKYSKPIYLFFFNERFSNIRSMANFLSPNSYGIVISYIIVWLAWNYLNKKRIHDLVLALLMLIPFISTYSKSGFLILVLGITMLLYNTLMVKNKIILILISFVFIISIYNIDLFSLLSRWDNSYFIRRLLKYLNSGNILGERSSGYLTLIRLYLDNWYTGVGVGSITGNNTLYVGWTDVHNEYLKFFLEGGIVAGMLFMVLILIWILKLFSIYRYKINRVNYNVYFIFSIMFFVSEMFFNYFDTPRESLVILVYSLGIFLLPKL